MLGDKMDEEEYLHQIAQLKHELHLMRKQHEEEVTDLKKELLAAHKEIRELKGRLATYENANTPPSKQRFKEPEETKDDEKGEKKRGRPPGAEGSTRETPTPTEKIEATGEKCPSCKANLGMPEFYETKVIEETPEPAPMRIIEAKVAHYNCPSCGIHVVARHPEIPKIGRFGVRLQAEIAAMRNEDRLPFRKLRQTLCRRYGIMITPAALLEIEGRVAGAIGPAYEEGKRKMRLAKVAYCDETTFRVDGADWWLWVFTDGRNTIFVIRRSRSGKVVDEILGKDFKGVIVSDGFAAYGNRGVHQRCWAHLIRELEFPAKKNKQLLPYLDELRGFFHRTKQKIASLPPPWKRKSIREDAEKWLSCFLDTVKTVKGLDSFATYLGNGMRDWLTFVEHEGVEPTNNIAERALRELIVIRKIIGTLRCERGADNRAALASMFATWKLEGKSPQAELLAALRS